MPAMGDTPSTRGAGNALAARRPPSLQPGSRSSYPGEDRFPAQKQPTSVNRRGTYR
jgi:hypothetical protein